MSQPRVVPFRSTPQPSSDSPPSPLSSMSLWQLLNSREGTLAQRAWIALVILGTHKPKTAESMVNTLERIASTAELEARAKPEADSV